MFMPETDSLTHSLEHVEFPISRDDLIQRYGDTPLQLDNDDRLTLETALLRIEQPEFVSISDLALAIGELQKNNRQTHL